MVEFSDAVRADLSNAPAAAALSIRRLDVRASGGDRS
jgi:hypothetical protein